MVTKEYLEDNIRHKALDYVENNLMQQGLVINEDTSLKKIIEKVNKRKMCFIFLKILIVYNGPQVSYRAGFRLVSLSTVEQHY